MKFMLGIVVAGVIVVAWNIVFLTIALDSGDIVDPTYHSEAR